jgi:hypothetical protein
MRLLPGTNADLEEELFHSKDSNTLNTGFVEGHNLTIRIGCSCPGRRTPCHAGRSESLEDHITLTMMYYYYVWPHMALKFGNVLRILDIQAGLATRRLSFRFEEALSEIMVD